MLSKILFVTTLAITWLGSAPVVACPFLDAQKVKETSSPSVKNLIAGEMEPTVQRITQDRRRLVFFDGFFSKLLQDIWQWIIDLIRGPPKDVSEAIARAKKEIEKDMKKDEAALYLRLSFSDCIGGVCDGCVDVTDFNNFGLSSPSTYW